ncbi:Threonylcarbamoyl-AMP synthase [Paenibacillus auburnensis]|uniref:Threonylcarbamoyl-AMP synthase n=1 Tax=Paenibacillus auburnensis TaxID=2905649 RepID=A0ABN8FXH9_9BACL|nr:L-threonylcarbamoyladenylate synthase [Paenibacillus auburnensis]CAH1191120.1 Threonylcarbamoyl-AMP synthase [Paenibacillus auburnensis]
MKPDNFSFAVQRKTGQYNDTQYWLLSSAGITGAERQYSAEDKQSIREAAAILAGGGTVAFPTETVYGLGADARNTSAVEAVFAAKGRPADNPLIVHIADREQLAEFVTGVDQAAEALMDAFWPGPLSLVLPVRAGVLSERVTAGLDTVAVRMPAHPTALALLRAATCPVAAPSANRSGRPSPTTAAHVREDLAGYIGGVLDDGPTGVGLESTVVQVQPDGTVAILRPGGITAERLAAVPGVVVTPPLSGGGEAAGGPEADAGNSPAPRAPGMKYTHYAPQGSLTIVSGSSQQRVAAQAAALLQAAQARGEKTGLLLFEEHLALYPATAAGCIVSLGSLNALEEGARTLYGALRRFDEAGATYILAEACPEAGLGAAIMNRLLKAAGGSVIGTD